MALRVVGAVYVIFSSGVCVQFASPPANRKQKPIPEEMTKTLLTKIRNKDTRTKYMLLTLLKYVNSHKPAEILFCVIKSLELLKNLELVVSPIYV
jgi:hypothetical protein